MPCSPDLALRVREVSDVNQKGKHTTTTAQLIRSIAAVGSSTRRAFGNFSSGTFGRRNSKVLSRSFGHSSPLCQFPDCTHTHESGCAVSGPSRGSKLAIDDTPAMSGCLRA